MLVRKAGSGLVPSLFGAGSKVFAVGSLLLRNCLSCGFDAASLMVCNLSTCDSTQARCSYAARSRLVRTWFRAGSSSVHDCSMSVHEWLIAGSLVVRWCFPHVFNVVLILLL